MSLHHNIKATDLRLADILGPEVVDMLEGENFAQALTHAMQPFLDRIEALSASVQRMEAKFPNGFTRDEEAEKATDLARSLQAEEKAIESARDGLKRVPLEMGRTIDGIARNAGRRCSELKQRALAPVSAWKTQQAELARQKAAREAEEARIAAERLQKAAADAAANRQMASAADLADAAVKVADHAERAARRVDSVAQEGGRVRTATGGTAFATQVKRVEIVDASQIPRRFLIVDEKALRRAVLDGEEVPGARLVVEESMRVR